MICEKKFYAQITITKYSNLTNLLNALRSFPNSNVNFKRMFSLLIDKNKKRNNFHQLPLMLLAFFSQHREEKHA